MGIRIMTAVAFLALAGCGGTVSTGDRHATTSAESVRDRRAFTAADSWYNPPPSTAEFMPLAKENFAQVDAALQGEAQTALADVPAKQITAAEAARLAGKPLPSGKEYVLLRAVVLFEGTGAFEIGIGDGSSVHVHQGCLGRRPAPMTRKALVAVLQSVPKTVFVSCSMAE